MLKEDLYLKTDIWDSSLFTHKKMFRSLEKHLSQIQENIFMFIVLLTVGLVLLKNLTDVLKKTSLETFLV